MSVELKPPSPEFVRLVCTGASPLSECGFCGRTHFVVESNGLSWEPGEHERLLRLAAADPARYVTCEEETIRVGNVQGKTVVEGCPCNGLRAVEDFIWREQDLILEYLTRRAVELHSTADRVFSRVHDIGQARDAARRLGGRVVGD
jgi:hypothetical protein